MSDSADVATYKKFAAELLLDPNNTQALIDQFAHLFNTTSRDRWQYYLPLARRAYLLEPGKLANAVNYGMALSAAGHLTEAVALFRWCVTHADDDDWRTRSLHQLGIALRFKGEDAEAIEWYRKAYARDPNPEIMKDIALALMAKGELYEGLKAFECRRQCTEAGIAKNPKKLESAVGRLPPDVAHWNGEDLIGKTIVVYAEEGIGDFFMVCRFIPLLRKLGPAKILLTGKVPDALELVADNIAVDGIVPIENFACDYVTGSMSVPWRVGIDYKDIDGKPYFNAVPATFPRRALLNVGLVWRGNPAYGRNSHRSMDFSNLTALFDVPDVAFYSLQIGEGGSREVTSLGYDGFVADLAPFARNWRATARLIANLDCLVTVDTACAHLAGALGVPAFVLVTRHCDWRWNKHSAHTAWYDSLRILRQYRQDDWSAVIHMAKMNLEDMVDERRKTAGSDQQGQGGRRAARARALGSGASQTRDPDASAVASM